MENLQITTICYQVFEIGYLKKRLEKLYSEDPLKKWDKHKTEVEIKLHKEDDIIKQKVSQYTPSNEIQFKLHIKELLDGGFIRPSNSKHSSPAFIVNKHSEQKRGKTRMVIDYKNLNDKTISFNYPIPNRLTALKKISGYNYFSKFDCKSGYNHFLLV